MVTGSKNATSIIHEDSNGSELIVRNKNKLASLSVRARISEQPDLVVRGELYRGREVEGCGDCGFWIARAVCSVNQYLLANISSESCVDQEI